MNLSAKTIATLESFETLSLLLSEKCDSFNISRKAAENLTAAVKEILTELRANQRGSK